jgi:hypothetical protein
VAPEIADTQTVADSRGKLAVTEARMPVQLDLPLRPREFVTSLALAAILAAASIVFFGIRTWHGLWFISFNDELMHLLGGRFLDSGGRLYRDFVDLHGPCIFMLAQIYGALFGWAHANTARLIPAGLTALAGAAVATSPALVGLIPRLWGTSLFFGLTAAVWLVQGLYLFSYYPVSGAFAVMALAWFVVPAWTGRRQPLSAAGAAGGASALMAFSA